MSFSRFSVLVLIGGVGVTGMVIVGVVPVVLIVIVWCGQGSRWPQVMPGDVRSGFWHVVLWCCFIYIGGVCVGR